MTSHPKRLDLSSAALAGARIGFAYGLVECLLLVWEPWLRLPGHAYPPRHAGFSLALIGIYAAGGAALAAVLFPLVRRLPIDRERALGLTAVFAFGIAYCGAAVFVGFERPSDWIRVLPVTVLLGGAILACFELARMLRWLHEPWCAAAVVFLPVWLVGTHFDHSSLVVRGLAIGCGVAVVAVAGLLSSGRRRKKPSAGLARSTAAWGLAAFLVAGGGAALSQQPQHNPMLLGPAPAAGPNLLFVVLDTVRADHLSLYGYERDTTPFLEELAQEAVVFTRAYSSGDMTLISHASLFTGKRADIHGAHFGPAGQPPPPLGEDHETLAEILAAKGYHTAAVAANHAFLNADFGLGQGFEIFDYRNPNAPLAAAPRYSLRHAVRNALKGFFPQRDSDRLARLAGPITQDATAHLERLARQDRPFFLFVNYMDAHWPYVPPAPYDTRYPGKTRDLDTLRYWALHEQVLRGNGPPSAVERAHLISQYDGAIAYLDHKLEELMGELRRLDLYDDTLVIITSDHGEEFGEEGLFSHGVGVYQGLIQVPLLIKLPGPPRAAAAEQAVNSCDVFATALEILGVSAPSGIQGEPQLGEEIDPRRSVISHSYPSFRAPIYNERFYRIQTAVMSGPFKLIHSTRTDPELYDLETDPGEDRNLYDPAHPVAQILADALPAAEIDADLDADPRDLPPETLERLKSLGYLD